jgi:hypothetical protein
VQAPANSRWSKEVAINQLGLRAVAIAAHVTFYLLPCSALALLQVEKFARHEAVRMEELRMVAAELETVFAIRAGVDVDERASQQIAGSGSGPSLLDPMVMARRTGP